MSFLSYQKCFNVNYVHDMPRLFFLPFLQISSENLMEEKNIQHLFYVKLQAYVLFIPHLKFKLYSITFQVLQFIGQTFEITVI